MANVKLSQIVAAGGPPASTDTLIGVTGGTTDNQFTLAQIGATVNLGTYNVQAYGWLPDGTDRSTQALALLALVSAAGGGTLYFPASTGKYRADSQLFIPNDSATIPNQVNFRFTGAGGGQIWGNAALTSVDASVLDLRFQAVDGNAKIESRGAGGLYIDNLTFIDGGSSNATPFIHGTNTTITIRGNTFIGSGSATQDAIVFGGASNQTPGGLVTSPYQGYGSTVENNHFRKLNRGVFGRTFANSLMVFNNSFLAGTGDRAMEFSCATGNVPDIIQAIYCVGNIIEMNSPRVYGVVLGGVLDSYFNNGFYDAAANVGYVSDYLLNAVGASSNGGWYNTFGTLVTGGVPFTQTGNVTQLSLNTLIGARSITSNYGDGIGASSFTGGMNIAGQWSSAATGAPGALNVRDKFNSTEVMSFGCDLLNRFIDCSTSGSGTNRTLDINPRGGPVRINGPLIYKPMALTLANGLNSNISFWAPDATNKSSYLRVTGPTGAFSLGGFSNLSSGVGAIGGTILVVYNSTAQAMTIVNESASSSAGNRIKTLTGADVVLRTGTSSATFIYDDTDTRWILTATN